MSASPRSIAVRFAAALAAGLLTGFAVQHWRGTAETNTSAAPSRVAPSAPASAATAARKKASAWVQEVSALDPAEYPACSLAWHAQFSLAADNAIQTDPRAAMEAFAAAPQLHRQGCVEIFTELLCREHPLLALEMAGKLHAVFSETVGHAVPGNVARLDPVKGLEMARNGPFVRHDFAFSNAGRGMARSGDVQRLTFLRQSLEGKELESALIGFAEELGWTKPEAALAAATENPDISKRLLSSAANTFLVEGNVDSALECVARIEKAEAPHLLKYLITQLFKPPPDSLMPAWQRLLELSRTDPVLMPPQQLESACSTLAYTLEDRDPDQLSAFAAAAPEGPLREEFLRCLQHSKEKPKQ